MTIVDAISNATFMETFNECQEPVVDPNSCEGMYQSSTTVGQTSGSEGLSFQDFYQISCQNFWPYCSETQAHQAFVAADIDNNTLLNQDEFMGICEAFNGDDFPDDDGTADPQTVFNEFDLDNDSMLDK